MADSAGPMVSGVDIRDLAGCTCLRLRRVARRATQIYDHMLAPAGLTVTQLGLLGHLYGALLQTGEGLSIGALAERLGMDPTTLNRNLKPIEAGGLAESGPGPRDRRVRTVRLTEKGRVKLHEAAPLWRQAQDQVNRQLGMETTLALNGLLDLSAAKLAA